MKIRTAPTLFALLLCLAAVVPANAGDEWLHVRSANFNLIGNASEKEIRRVGTKLEQFREVFRTLFGGANLNSPIPTNVVVFKSDSSYKPFKPKRADGKTDNFIAGYFQPGDDVNYITLAAGGADAGTFGTIYHEYVHFIVDTNIGKSGVPAWFNEGLAEYYSTFVMEEDIKAKLGVADGDHLNLLQQNKLLPLDSFFNTSNSALKGHGSGTRSIFYAQAWAVMHYLIANEKTAGLGKYLNRSMKGSVDEAAFRDAFQMSYADMEKELRKYVGRATYLATRFTFNKKLLFDADMKVTPMSEAESNAYLGDLLYHTNRPDDAETYLRSALTADPNSSMANTSMGMVKVSQRKYAEAKAYLDKAIEKNQKNHLAYYHAARLLSREGRDEFGYIREFPADRAVRMRELLKKAIEINPEFTESYEMLAFVNLVTNTGLDEAVSLMMKAMRYQPGNQRYALRIAELLIRQEKFADASGLAARISKSADDPQIKQRADQVLEEVKYRQDINARNEEARKRYEAAVKGSSAGGPPRLAKPTAEAEPSPEELRKQQVEFEVMAINRELRKAQGAEVRFVGKLDKIECKAGRIVYTVTSDTETFSLTSKDFQGLHLSSYVPDAGSAEVGCGLKPATMRAVLTYKPATAKSAVRGDLVAVEFVPPHFRLVDVPAEAPQAAESAEVAGEMVIVETVSGDRNAPTPTPESFEEGRRNDMFRQIQESLRKPGAGEIRVLGFIEKSECSSKGMFFYIKAGAQVLKLSGGTEKERPELKAFTPDIENLQIGCGMKAVEIPVVVTYRDAFDKKSKAAGPLLALEFVPKSFVLQP